MTRLCPLLLSALLAGCASPALRRVDHHVQADAIPSTVFTFDGGASLTVVADQGVRRFWLETSAEGFQLAWDGLSDETCARTLQVEGPFVRSVEDDVAVGGGLRVEPYAITMAPHALFLQGNGEAHFLSADELRVRYGVSARAYLGVVMNGARIMETLPGSPAEAAGLHAQDELQAAIARGERLEPLSRFQLAELLPRLRPGERVTLVVRRGDRELQLPVVLGERPARSWNQTDG